MLRAAIIGTGKMGRNHLRVYRELEGVEVVGIADADPATAREVGSTFGVPAYTDFRDLLSREKPTVVSIAVPTAHHFELARELILRGVHVLVEKPISPTVEQGEMLLELAQSNRVVLAVGHIERFNPAIVELERRLSKGVGGQVYQLHASRLSPVPARCRDADVVIDLASHDIDLMRHLMKQPIDRVYAETLRSQGSHREDVFAGTLRFRGGALGALHVNWMTPIKTRKLSVTCSDGLFECDLLRQRLWFYAHGRDCSQKDAGALADCLAPGVDEIGIERSEPLVAELRDFVDAVEHHRPPCIAGSDAIETLRIARALLESGQRAEVVRPSVGWLRPRAIR